MTKTFTPNFCISLMNTATNEGIMDFGYSDLKTPKGAIKNNLKYTGGMLHNLYSSQMAKGADKAENYTFIVRRVTSKQDGQYGQYFSSTEGETRTAQIMRCPGNFPIKLLEQLGAIKIPMTELWPELKASQD